MDKLIENYKTNTIHQSYFNDTDFKNKYIKYKNKYNKLKKSSNYYNLYI